MDTNKTDRPSEHVVHVRDETVVFAVITLLFYLFIYPVGFLLNLVGLMTGPKRGCFVQMFVVFVVLPIILIVILAVMGVDVIEKAMNFVR